MTITRSYHVRVAKATANSTLVKNEDRFSPAHLRLLKRAKAMADKKSKATNATPTIHTPRSAKINAKIRIMVHLTRHDSYEQQLIKVVDKDPMVRRLF